MFKWFSKKTKDPGEGYISKAQYKEDVAYAREYEANFGNA